MIYALFSLPEKKTSKNDEFAFQKLWILSIFVNACRQVNVEPKIICQ